MELSRQEHCNRGTSLAVQWLRLCLPIQGVQVQSLVREPRSHMPCSQKNKEKQYCNKFNKDLKKKKEYCNRVPFPTQGDLPHPGIKPLSVSPALADEFFATSTSWEAHEWD